MWALQIDGTGGTLAEVPDFLRLHIPYANEEKNQMRCELDSLSNYFEPSSR